MRQSQDCQCPYCREAKCMSKEQLEQHLLTTHSTELRAIARRNDRTMAHIARIVAAYGCQPCQL